MDPIADMLTIIRNAITARHTEAKVPYSNFKQDLLAILEKEGILNGVTKDAEKKMLQFSITSEGGKALITSIRRLSTPGRRFYVGWKEIPRPTGNGLIIISTSQGLMTGYAAHKRKLGGELICEIA